MKTIKLMVLMGVSFFALISVVGCSGAPKEPSTEIVMKCVSKSFVEAIRESNPAIHTKNGLLHTVSMLSCFFDKELPTPKLEKKNIVTRKDKDGVERKMWSIVIDAVGNAQFMVSGLVEPQPSTTHVRYTLYFYENAQGEIVHEKGKVEVM